MALMLASLLIAMLAMAQLGNTCGLNACALCFLATASGFYRRHLRRTTTLPEHVFRHIGIVRVLLFIGASVYAVFAVV